MGVGVRRDSRNKPKACKSTPSLPAPCKTLLLISLMDGLQARRLGPIPNMEWPKLLSYQRLGNDYLDEFDRARPPWQIDYDRIVFSSAFRRLQDKTQVFPLSGSDYIRTRLTHSLEVSTVARTMGTMVGKSVLERHGSEAFPVTGLKLSEVLTPADVGMIAASGSLAHDIGNPPFGHSGEDAIRYWFLNSKTAESIRGKLKENQIKDFENWEGNAEGFRILARQQMARNNGGLKLTAATIGAFTKYPTGSYALVTKSAENVLSAKKPGYFVHDLQLWEQVAEELGLVKSRDCDRWCRHPIAFLTEAADDICYRIIDLEDGFRLRHIPYEILESAFHKLLGDDEADKIHNLPDWDLVGRSTYLRSLAFNKLVREIVQAFIENEPSILEGTFNSDLVSKVPSYPALKEMKQAVEDNVYSARSVLEIEAAGFEIIPGLLEAFVSAVESGIEGANNCRKGAKLMKLIPREFLSDTGAPSTDPYERLLGIVDFVAGMTDSYALTLFRRLKGVSLPT
jgi:dGTPase